MKTEELIQQLSLRVSCMQLSSIRKDDPLIDLLQEAVFQLQDYVVLDEEYFRLIAAPQDRPF